MSEYSIAVELIAAGCLHSAIHYLRGHLSPIDLAREIGDDAELLAAMNELHSAELSERIEDRQHFTDSAELRLRALSGDPRAREELRRTIELAAVNANEDLHSMTLRATLVVIGNWPR